MTPERPLFIPLKTEPFLRFRLGSKDTEYRPYGPRWNERTCRIGRAVTLSKGYGKANRLTGTVRSFARSLDKWESEEWRACYGDRRCVVACIGVDVKGEV